MILPIADVCHTGRLCGAHVRFWHKADMPLTLVSVRFRG